MQNNIPVRTLKRLSFYLSYLEDINSNGVLYISTPKMAQDLTKMREKQEHKKTRREGS